MNQNNQQPGSADLSAATSETFALYKAVNEMMAHLGAHGEIDARSDQAEAVMAALHNLDGGKVAQRVEDLVEKAFMPRDQATRLAVSEYCAVNEPSDAIAASRRAAGGDVLAWAHEDGRVIPASTKAAAERDGGAMASSLAGYTIPLGPIPASLPDVAMPFDRKEFMRLVLQSACEIPDRDSPENQPEMLLLTTKELENIMTSAFENVDEDAELVAQPAEGSAQVPKPLTGEALAQMLAGWQVNDYGYRMLINGDEIGFTLQNLLDIVNKVSERAAPERSDTPAGLANVPSSELELELVLRRGPRFKCQSGDCRSFHSSSGKWDKCPSCERKGYLCGSFEEDRQSPQWKAWEARTIAAYRKLDGDKQGAQGGGK